MSRVLLSIQERASGDLTLIMKQGVSYGQPGTYKDKEADVIVNRCSIHTSRRSRDGNLLKYTYVLSNGEKKTSAHFTKAIKTTRAFAPVVFVRSDGLVSDGYIAKPSQNNIHLTSYDPEAFMLFYSIFVGPPDKQFTWYGAPPDFMRADKNHDQLVLYGSPGFSFKQISFTNFSLIFLWNFMTSPALDNAENIHSWTLNDQDIEAIEDAYTKRLHLEKRLGFDETLAVGLFHSANNSLRENFFTAIAKDHPDLEPKLLSSMRLMASFFQFPSFTTPEMIRHLNMCSMLMDPNYPFFPIIPGSESYGAT